MQRVLTENKPAQFTWLDVINPTPEELQKVAQIYQLHASSVQDCLQPDHLPKYEQVGETSFIISRLHTPDAEPDADTIQELTNKVAIFYTDTFVITIHRQSLSFIDSLKQELIDTGKCRGPFHLVNRVIRAVFFSYEVQAGKLTQSLQYYEDNLFFQEKTQPILKGMYFLKRQVDLLRRMLILSRDIVENIDDPAENNPHTRDTRDLYVRLQTVYDTLSDNTNQLLNLYFSISSQRTNEVMRILTIFSVFFMPLTFIAGIYGMNFKVMPELEWKWGYPAVIILMIGVGISIYIWFKRKGWL
jgi:magnesium transporter